jgi:hypothetical protein
LTFLAGRFDDRNEDDLAESSADAERRQQEERQAEQLRDLEGVMPELFPRLPSKDFTTPDLQLSNPYADNGPTRYPCLRVTTVFEDRGVIANGYIKFRLRMVDVEPTTGVKIGVLDNSQQLSTRNHPQRPPVDFGVSSQRIHTMPPGFGTVLKFDARDEKLRRFCKYNQPF